MPRVCAADGYFALGATAFTHDTKGSSAESTLLRTNASVVALTRLRSEAKRAAGASPTSLRYAAHAAFALARYSGSSEYETTSSARMTDVAVAPDQSALAASAAAV